MKVEDFTVTRRLKLVNADLELQAEQACPVPECVHLEPEQHQAAPVTRGRQRLRAAYWLVLLVLVAPWWIGCWTALRWL